MSKFNTWQHGTQEDLIETVIMSVSSQFQEWIDSNKHSQRMISCALPRTEPAGDLLWSTALRWIDDDDDDYAR